MSAYEAILHKGWKEMSDELKDLTHQWRMSEYVKYRRKAKSSFTNRALRKIEHRGRKEGDAG